MTNETLQRGNEIQAKIKTLQEHWVAVKNKYMDGDKLCYVRVGSLGNIMIDLATESLGLEHVQQKMYSLYMSEVEAQISKLEQEFKKL